MLPKSIKSGRTLEMFLATRKVATRIIEYGKRRNAIYYSDENTNPYSNQSKGLFLEMYYGKPGHLWTPWGRWIAFRGNSGSYTGEDLKLLEQELIKCFHATVHRPVTHSKMGVDGPIYALHKLGRAALPEPREIEKGDYTTFGVANKE